MALCNVANESRYKTISIAMGRQNKRHRRFIITYWL